MFGPVLIAILIGAIWLDEWLGSRTGYVGLIILPILTLAVLGAVQEIAPILRTLQTQASRRVLSVCALLGLGATAMPPSLFEGDAGMAAIGSAGGLAMLIAMLYYSRHKSAEGVVLATGVALIGFVYLGLMAGFLFLIRRDFGGWELLVILLVIKSYDIGAFFTGSAIGKHKLIPWLSPGKTWEGLIGGMVTSTGVAIAALQLGKAIYPDGTESGVLAIPIWQAAVVGAGLGLVGQAGDLIASVFKRDAGVKDYSKLLPGFGGIMDVLDSPLLAAPVAFWALTWISG